MIKKKTKKKRNRIRCFIASCSTSLFLVLAAAVRFQKRQQKKHPASFREARMANFLLGNVYMCCDGCSFYCSVSGEQSGCLKPGRPLQLSAANNRIQQFVLMLQTGFCNHHWNKLFFFFLCLTPTLLYLLLCASAVWLNRDTSFGYSVGFCRCGIQQKSCVCVCAHACVAQ